MDTFSSATTSRSIWNMQLLQRWIANPIVPVAILINFGVHMNMLFIMRVKILVLTEWSYYPHTMLSMSLEWFTNPEHIVQSL